MPVWDPYIRATAFIGFEDEIARAGCDPAQLFARAGLDPRALTDTDRLVSFRQFVWLLDRVVEETGDQSFALRWVANMPEHFPVLGPLTLLAYFVPDVREWLTMGLQYWRCHTNAFSMLVVSLPDPGLKALRYHPESMVAPTRQLVEFGLALLCRMVPSVTAQPGLCAHTVRFQHARPADTSLHEQLFDCPVEFGQAHNEIVFENRVLDLPTHGSLRVFRPVVDYFIRLRSPNVSIGGHRVSNQVALHIATLLGCSPCTMDVVAMSLNTTARTLQRQLTREGTTFGEVLEKVRERMACKLLLESNAPANRIAGLLGYSAQSPFNIAFKRWTGETPNAYRKRVQKEMYGEGGRPDSGRAGTAVAAAKS